MKRAMKPIRDIFYVLLVVFFAMRSAAADSARLPTNTPLESANLDPAAFTEWVDGAERAMKVKNGPRQVMWTQDSGPEWDGAHFGETNTPGARHLRVGWKQPMEFGAILVRGGGRVSALKDDAAYPGKPNDESEWIPASRIEGNRISSDEVGEEQYAIWVFPKTIKTRAIRFTHIADLTEKSYAGWLGGACVLSERCVDIAPQALIHASSQDEHANRVVDETNNNTWAAWDNGENGAAQMISPDHPEWLTLVWPKLVPIDSLCALWTGFSECEVQVFSGPADRNPAEASETDWRTLRHFAGLENQYPRALGTNFLSLDGPIEARAIRLRITHATTESHPHLNGKTMQGKRVWLGELVVFRPLGDKPIESALPPPPSADEFDHPPIPVRFNLKEGGLVTLVIEASNGRRVRNLISETPFPAGDNVTWWDGLDDLGRDIDAAKHGLYSIPGQLVAPGSYRVRGLWRKPLDLRFEFSVYNSGHPAWETLDSTGAWLANHTPPSSTLFLPADRAPGGKPLVYLGSYVTEGGHGLAWVDLDGRKQGGRGWIGGAWTGAPYLARDLGENRDAETYAYVAAAWDADLRLTALTPHGDKPVVKYVFPGGKETAGVTGMAVRDGLLVCSLPKEKQLLWIDVRAGKIVGSTGLDDPRGLAFDAKGNLLVLAGKHLLRLPVLSAVEGPASRNATPLTTTDQILISEGLEDPQLLTLDQDGNIYISDRGASHQVKVFSSNGKFLHAIGHPGAPKAGPHDPLHMNNPAGLTIDSNFHLWVAETDFQPKRVSVWTLDGQLVNAFYGPAEYGGGGTLDPADKTRFYFHGMEFALDWKTGTDKVVSVFHRPVPTDLKLPDGFGVSGMPETPIYVDRRRYFTNCFDSNPTNGASIAMLWLDRKGIAVPVASMGRANDWSLLKTEPFKSRWPAGTDPDGDIWKNQTFFIWSDLNGDGQLQPDELQMARAGVGGITVMPDLSCIAARLDEKIVKLAPQKFTDVGVPIYAIDSAQTLGTGAQSPPSSGGDQALLATDGWTITTIAPKPFAPQSIGGIFQGNALWSYPNLWPGLHASHEAAVPDRPGELIGVTRLLGGFVNPRDSDAGPLFAVNGNMGDMYLFTSDGLFVATLFKDARQGRSWAMPLAERNMRLNDLTLHDENFWPSITQTSDGKVYLVDGGRTSLVRIDGLETIHRLPASTLSLTDAELKSAQAWTLAHEAARQKEQGVHLLHVAIRSSLPVVDGKLEDWAGSQWAVIDRRGVAANFDSHSKPYDASAAVVIAGDRMYVAYRTNEENLLENSGEMPNAPFKTGGALDVMIGGNLAADPHRAAPVFGDIRLLVTLVKGKPLALIYRPVDPSPSAPVPFSSPWRTITIDRVNDVSSELKFAQADGNVEFSIPLKLLGLKPAANETISADIGLLRGNGFQTTQRVYWNNKATGITADVPSEAELTPALWGRWEFVPAP